ncbi:Metallo-dependent phosphatase-like protein [Gongronella butleri]|nr:Metallo-dependent phosphatase-like protein [Gongronella butleri]
MLFVAVFALLFVCQLVLAGDPNAVGGAGKPGVPDQYNAFSNWNITYAGPQPQQVHLSIGDEGKYVQVEFTTLDKVDSAFFKYWPKSAKHGSKKAVTVTRGNNWEFVDGGNLKRATYMHKFQSKRLKPATVYEYQVGTVSANNTQNGTVLSDVFEFHTAAKSESFKFVAIGDLGVNNAVTMKQLTNLADSHQYDFMTVSGDQGYDLSDMNGIKGDQYMNFLQQVYAKLPFMGAIGNHEDAYNYTHYINRFNNVPFETSRSSTPLFWSFNYKSLHLVSVSTEAFFLNKFGSQDQMNYFTNWLDQDLERANKDRHKRPWIVVISHHPIYCSDTTSDCQEDAPMIRAHLEPVLTKHNVDIFLTGHVHNYERTYPIVNNTRVTTNLHNAPSFIQIVNGDAGQPSSASTFNASVVPNDWSAVRFAGYGFSTIEVSHKSLDFTHHEVSAKDGSLGGVIDHFTLTKS